MQRFRDGLLAPAARRGASATSSTSTPRRGVALARALGWLMAAELRAHGVDISFAPCVDLDYGVSEAIGERAFHACRRGRRPARPAPGCTGMREAGMAATAKHFPGHGAVVADSHLTLPVDRRPLVDLTPDLTPYRRLIANGLPAVMVAHILFPAVDPDPASLSRLWIRDVLRGELGFQGVVFADDLSMKGAAAYGDIVTRARQALAAGCDMLPVCNHRPSVIELLDGLRRRTAAGLQPAPGAPAWARRRPRRGRRWRACPSGRHARELLARVSAPPSLTLDPGGTPT